jgi:dienelactone hydrolase
MKASAKKSARAKSAPASARPAQTKVKTRTQKAPQTQTNAASTPHRVDSPFLSQGLKCSAWFYTPGGRTPHERRYPTIVMAFGFAGEKTFRLPSYAERFVAEGFAVLVFDYRNFGASEGMPRNLVNPWRHVEDYRAAIAHARNLPHVDPDQIILFGSSFSGGHVLKVAAEDSRIRCVLSQVPFVDGIASLRIRRIPDILGALAAGLRDAWRAVTGQKPYTLPVFSGPDRLAFMNTPESEKGYASVVEGTQSWENACPARIALSIAFYRPIASARKIRCPVFIVLAKYDSLVPAEAVLKTVYRIKGAMALELECGHFEPYHGAWFEQSVRAMIQFLRMQTG